MARRKHYRGLVRFPGLGRLPLVPSGPVRPADVILGAGLGLAGSIGLQIGANKALASGLPIPGILASGSPVIGGLVSASVLYLAQKKKNKSRATGHAVGAALAGLAVWGFGALQNLAAGMPVMSQTAGYGAPLFSNPRLQGWGFSPRTLPAGLGGPIFNNPNVNLSRLARLQGIGDENEDGMTPAP
jgi:hypothetical protein